MRPCRRFRRNLEQQIRRGELVEVEQTAGRPGRAYTTPAMIALEQRTMALMREGQQTQPPLIRPATQSRGRS